MIVHEAVKPDLVSDIPAASKSASEPCGEVDVTVASADSAALGHPGIPI